ncbi:Iron-sulfur cluster assembly ATPase protein SufC [Candidatus Syntrophocurvum alkaliphilum]|uniref:Iron-sulfur cluster assembly ATPase protein SufC n=1 Tax=Candidatus Syntrophocurvum alkaliphilum TaxID=2293317 RepID=A0A6I6D787_9FIRM|nr:ATP-binding cassette domain-containing protein [Candidatus Syntrophocurvum alkaliphilum]QGT99026.1 Iron-sulfur cluster assembly ATPase protein SufC [Candidatus Syntrophocurvum alkaliphilum]
MLKLENLSLQLVDDNGDDKEIIKGVNIEFQKGKVYAITGPNGGGKTSLAKLIMGIYKQNNGKIYLDGNDISNLNVSERADLGIAYAFQQPPRFKGLGIQDILKIASPNIDTVQTRIRLRDVGLCPEEFLERDLGAGLSGGEIKRIEIAQILARDAKISIFDEPEAGVDLWTIRKLIEIIVNEYKGNPEKTAIIITHNQNVLPICDEIIVVDEGIIKGKGNSEEIWPLIKDDIECKMIEQCRGEMIHEIK